MKNKLNNKGFAVTTVVYAILLLLIILMFTILLLYRNTYRNQKQFSADVQDELNEYLVDQTPPDTNPPECFLTSVKNADDTYTLTISEGDSPDIDLEEGYSFDGINFSSKKTTTVSRDKCGSNSCTYQARTKDASGNMNDVEKYPCKVKVDFDTTAPTCTLTVSGRGSSVTLTISSTDRDILSTGYSFDGTNFTSTTQTTVTSAGTYKAYVKDTSGNISNACNATVDERIATFKIKSSYLPFIESPSDGATDSCLVSSGESCSVDAPEITLNLAGTIPYKNYTKGWGTSSTSTTITYSAGDSITLSGNDTFYTVFKSDSSSSGGSSSGGSCGCQPGIEDFGECIDGKRKVIRCDTTSQPCSWDSDGNPTKYSGGKKTYYENC